MTEKTSFPDNWSDLSDEQVLANIRYLSSHYKNYEIKRIDKNSISIEDVHLTKAKFQKIDTFRVNGKFYQYRSHSYGGIYEYLNELFDDCEQEIEKRDMLKKLEKKRVKKLSREIWWDNNGMITIIGAMAVVGFSCTLFVGIKETKKQQKIDEKVEQYEKTLPNYQEYQQKIANYRDSLERASK